MKDSVMSTMVKTKPLCLDFGKIKTAIARQFDVLSQHDMFRVDAEGDALWITYIDSFPPGTNPTYRERSEHDCSCCRQFIRAVGNAVAIIDGKIVSLWDVQVDEPAYQAVADAMSAYVKAKPIRDIFLFRDRNVGADKSREDAGDHVVTWSHFHVTLPKRNTGKDFYCDGPDIATKLGEARSSHDVFLRSLKELTIDALDTVLELIAQNSLYRGQEHKHTVEKFRVLKKEFDKRPASQRDTFVWANLASTPAAISHIRNTSIGTLLVDLSEGVDLEDAVRKFEAVVAPQNYKRPTALVTKGMVDKAKATIEELGLTSALDRRYARLSDVSVNNIIFADRSARKSMKDDVFSSIAIKKAVPKNLDKIETIPIDKFITDIVPNVESIEVMVENRHASNLVSLIAPVNPKAGRLFKWDNDFSWAYNGDVADSIKERVKKAGGNVTGDLCCRLAWFNFDDLDFHMQEPRGGYHIYFGNKGPSPGGGRLDVDMNAGDGHTREPVENIFYPTQHNMKEGVYNLFVHQFNKRENDNIGFEAEIDYLGEVSRFTYQKPMRHNENICVAKFHYSHANGLQMQESLPASTVSKTLWNVNTQDFHRVSVLMQSPNYWDGQRGQGNRHYFFMLADCVNTEPARGFFNEFLRTDLDRHRKVFEIVGGKMKTPESTDQLSGLGFSETKRNEILTRVKGNFTRTLKVLI
jgi:hypothetical protein